MVLRKILRVAIKLLFFGIIELITLASCLGIEQNKRTGNIIIKKIEHFRNDNGCLPNSVSFSGTESGFISFQFDNCDTTKGLVSIIEIDDEIFIYKKIDSLTYMVGFGTVLGEGVYYYSDKKEWMDSRALSEYK